MILTLILTEACDGRCTYCPQLHSKRRMSRDLARRALRRLVPLLDTGQELNVNFYGGEPLREKETVLDIANRLPSMTGRDRLHLALTTNGSGLDEAFLQQMEPLPFLLIVSHDGLWQNETRPGVPAFLTLDHLEKLLASFPGIESEYNCVCPPQRIGRLRDNILFFQGKTDRPVSFGLDSISPWTGESLSALDLELKRIRSAGLEKSCPDFFTPPEPGRFICDSRNRISVDPDGFIWGCHEYCDLFRRNPKAGPLERHRVGHIDMPTPELRELISRWPACALHEQSQWMAGNKACLLCDQFLFCRQCPVNGAYSSGFIGRLPPWVCSIQRVLARHRA